MDLETFFYYFGYLYPPVFIIGVLCALDVILKGRTAQGTIAWALCLVLFPIITIPFYLIFGGRKFYGYVKARRKDESELKEVGTVIYEKLQKFAVDTGIEPKMALENLAKMPATNGNLIKVLENGQEKFSAVYEAISKAEKYILVQYYMVHHDKTGTEFKDALLKKAAEGVKIYFLYDAIGSYELSGKYLKELRKGGITVAQFGSYRFVRNKFQLNFRNHRKIIVIDGDTAFCGGLNVGDEYVGLDKKLSPWRDTHLKVKGPAVECIQLTFVEDWYSMESSYPQELIWEPEEAGDAETLVLPTGPADELDTCSHAFIASCNSAKNRLWISTPYFVPSAEVASALEAAAVRGVDVRVIVPDKADNLMVQLSSRSFIESVMKYGVKFYRYKNGFLHQKAMLVDDTLASIGTANLDNRSFSLNFELMLYGFDKTFINDIDNMLSRDFDDSEVVPAGDFSSKSFIYQLLARICRLLSPLQ